MFVRFGGEGVSLPDVLLWCVVLTVTCYAWTAGAFRSGCFAERVRLGMVHVLLLSPWFAVQHSTSVTVDAWSLHLCSCDNAEFQLVQGCLFVVLLLARSVIIVLVLLNSHGGYWCVWEAVSLA